VKAITVKSAPRERVKDHHHAMLSYSGLSHNIRQVIFV
jgi:hypothetical protein